MIDEVNDLNVKQFSKKMIELHKKKVPYALKLIDEEDKCPECGGTSRLMGFLIHEPKFQDKICIQEIVYFNYIKCQDCKYRVYWFRNFDKRVTFEISKGGKFSKSVHEFTKKEQQKFIRIFSGGKKNGKNTN